MQMVGRKYTATTGAGYRFGFNGKEKDGEVKGESNQQDYGMRIYDPRLGRFLSVDPLTKGFPYYSSYQFAGNTPIQAIDLDGTEPEWMIDANGKLTTPMIALLNAAFDFSMEVLNSATFIDQNLVTKFSANTFFSSIFYSKNKMNYFERVDKNRLWINQWLNLIPHEIDHVRQFHIGGNTGTTSIYLLGMLFNKIKHGDWYSDEHILEQHPYNVIEPFTLNLMTLHDGIVVKILQSPDMEEWEKVEALTYFGLEAKLNNEKTKLNKILENANSNGKVTKKENKKIKKQTILVTNLIKNLDAFDKNKVNEIKEKMKSVENPQYKDLTEDEKKDRNKNFKKI
jgi:RHS repeat-associated protein